jgi:hypothetical protein
MKLVACVVREATLRLIWNLEAAVSRAQLCHKALSCGQHRSTTTPLPQAEYLNCIYIAPVQPLAPGTVFGAIQCDWNPKGTKSAPPPPHCSRQRGPLGLTYSPEWNHGFSSCAPGWQVPGLHIPSCQPFRECPVRT